MVMVSVQGQCSAGVCNPDHCDFYGLFPWNGSRLRHIGGYKPPLSGVGERLLVMFPGSEPFPICHGAARWSGLIGVAILWSSLE